MQQAIQPVAPPSSVAPAAELALPCKLYEAETGLHHCQPTLPHPNPSVVQILPPNVQQTRSGIIREERHLGGGDGGGLGGGDGGGLGGGLGGGKGGGEGGGGGGAGGGLGGGLQATWSAFELVS